MSHERILGHLAQRFAVSPENLATDALTWLLTRSAAARVALIGLVRAKGCEIPEELTFTRQAKDRANGRPDVVGLDGDGRERLLIEAKFAAALTDQQPGGYLQRFPADADGALLVVAPSARVPTLWVELLRAIPELAPTAPAPSAVPGEGSLSEKVTEHTTLVLVSWRSLVTQVLQAIRAGDGELLAQDGEQLLALTEAMDRAAFMPLRPGDLDERTAGLIHQLDTIIDGARRSILADASSVAERIRNRSSHGRIFYGWYLRSRKTKKAIWYGYLPRAWARHGLSPLWIQVKPSVSWSSDRLRQALHGLHDPGEVGIFDDKDGAFLIPLMVPSFAGEQEVVAAIRAQLEDAFGRLDAVVPEGESVIPDEPDLDDAGLGEDDPEA